MDRHLSIWDKVDYSIVGAAPVNIVSEPVSEEEKARQRRDMRRARRVGDFVATIVWLYVLLKLFVVDFDQRLVDRYAPDAQWIIDYKFFVFIGLFALLVLFTRHLGRLLLVIMYVVFFPVVVVCWKIPRAVYRTKSWVAAFATINIAASILMNLRYAIVFSAVVLIAALGVVIGESTPALTTAAVVLGLALVVSIGRTIRYAVVPSRFLRRQQAAIETAVNANVTKQLTSVNESLRRDEVLKFSPDQQQAFVQSLSQAVLVHRFLYFWAYQLEQYRKSPGSLFFSTLSYIWLLAQCVAALTLINYAVYKIDPSAFEYATAPSIPIFVRFAFTSLYGSEIDALHPVSDVANLISIGAMIIGIVILATLLLTWFLNYRYSRDQTAIRDSIDRIREQGRSLDDEMQAEYEVSVSEAVERLAQLRAGLLSIIMFLSQRIPPDFEDHPEAAPSAD